MRYILNVLSRLLFGLIVLGTGTAIAVYVLPVVLALLGLGLTALLIWAAIRALFCKPTSVTE